MVEALGWQSGAASSPQVPWDLRVQWRSLRLKPQVRRKKEMTPPAAGLAPAGLLGPPTQGTSGSCAAVHLLPWLALLLVTEAAKPRRELGAPPLRLSAVATFPP